MTALPIYRADCIDGERPCPWVSCKHHLLWERPEAWARGGDLRCDDHLVALLDRMPDTCALDVADRGEKTLAEVAAVLGITRQRVEQMVRDMINPESRPSPSGKLLRRIRVLRALARAALEGV